ncbi:uncharacterized protein NEMAJ01_1317 [Nematocida major]|uniref:uncharacterized protein n=1 Tax=Nematocida major TaxID=1912982 RepID=UPI00200889F3|nr:uncharacterized protein NEMAJ01_1317 [Nematocida major]KAH9386421.1 hypothetical protein NEMAJ01_1317 [Nematocida major]
MGNFKNNTFVLKRIAVRAAAVALCVAVVGIVCSGAKNSMGSINDPVKAPPKDLADFLWISLFKTIKILSLISESMLSVNMVYMATNPGVVCKIACFVQFVVASLFVVNLKTNMKNLFEAFSGERYVLFKHASVSGKEAPLSTSPIKKTSSSLKPKKQEDMTGKGTGSKHTPISMPEVDMADPLVDTPALSFVRNLSLFTIGAVYVFSLVKTLLFIGGVSFLLLDSFVLSNWMSGVLYGKFPFFSVFVDMLALLSQASCSPKGTLLSGALLFFGASLSDYYNVLAEQNSYRRKVFLFRKNRKVLGNVLVRGFLLFLIISLNLNIFIVFMDPIVEMALSKKTGDIIITLLCPGKEPRLIRDENRKGINYDKELKASKIIRAVGVAFSGIYAIIALKTLFFAHGEAMFNVVSGARSNNFIPIG